MDLKVLLDACAQKIVEVIDLYLRAMNEPKKNFKWLILEYTLQSAFPPTIGLAQDFETESDIESGPLVVYNAADLEVFSENDDWTINFSAHDQFFDNLNGAIEKKYTKKTAALVFDCYVTVCRRLLDLKGGWTGLKLAPDFHILARDFEINNELDFLKTFMPPPQFAVLEDSVKAYEVAQNSKLDNDLDRIYLNEVLAQESRKYATLKELVSGKDLSRYYSVDEVLFLEPFKYQALFHRPSPRFPDDLANRRPVSPHFYEYCYHDGVLAKATYFSDSRAIWESYYTYSKDLVTVHKYYTKKKTPEFDSYESLTFSDGKIGTYEDLSYYHLTRIEYACDKGDEPKSSTTYRCLFSSRLKSEDTSHRYFAFDNGGLASIRAGDSRQSGLVYFSRDKSFIDGAIDEYCRHYLTYLQSVLEKQGPEAQKIDALVFEIDQSMPLIMQMYFVRTGNYESIIDYTFYEDDSALMNMAMYLSTGYLGSGAHYFDEVEVKGYTETAYQSLFSKALDLMIAKANPAAQLHYKSIYDSWDEILADMT